MSLSCSLSANTSPALSAAPANTPTHHGEPGHPADQRSPLEPPGQGEWPAQPRGRPGRAEPGAHQPGTDVTPRRKRHGRGGERGDQGGEEGEDPPPFPGERSDLVRQAERGEPRQPRTTVDGADQERDAEHGSADAPGGRGALGELRDQCPDGGERAADRGQLQSHGQRPGGGKPLGDLTGRGNQRQHQIAGPCHGQRRDQPGLPTDHGGTEQLTPAGLLIGGYAE
ncbi:hypothetical protein GCM10027062_37850 [Nocardioides hungaricus]